MAGRERLHEPEYVSVFQERKFFARKISQWLLACVRVIL